MLTSINLQFNGFRAELPHFSALKSEFKTVKYTLGIASALSRLVRCIVMLADRAFRLSFNIKGLVGGTYFVSAVLVPLSLYDVGEALRDFKGVSSLDELVPVCTKIANKCGVVSKDIVHVLKGLNNVGLLGRRQAWMLGFTPYTIVFASLSFFGRLYSNYATLANTASVLKDEEHKGMAEEKKIVLKTQIKDQRLALVSTTLDLIGLSVLSFTPFFIPGYLLLGVSAAFSLHKACKAKHD